jgi:perosamine synthetase
MITTDDEALAERCRVMSLHGISKDAWQRYSEKGSWYYEVVAPGFKYNLTDLAAALGLAQFRKLERMWQRRCQIAQAYTAAFAELADYVQVPCVQEGIQHAWHLYILRFRDGEGRETGDGGRETEDGRRRMRFGLRSPVPGLSQTGDRGRGTEDRSPVSGLRSPIPGHFRNEFIAQLRQRGIGCSVHFIPLHVHPYYRETYGYCPEDLPVAYREYLRAVSLPIYSRMTDADVERVIRAVREIVLGDGRRETEDRGQDTGPPASILRP